MEYRKEMPSFGAGLGPKARRALGGVGGELKGNMRVFAFRDVLLLTSQGLNGGLTVIYTMTVLEADALDIGLLGTVNAIAGLFFALIGGWIGSRYNMKKIFLIGAGMTMFNPLVYALAPSWRYLLIVNITGPIGEALAGPAGFSIRVSSVDTKSLTKATAMLYTTHALTNMIVPPVGAALVTLAGGLQSLRIVYLIETCINISAWVYTAKKLDVAVPGDETARGEKHRPSPREFFNDFLETYRISRKEGTWMFLLLAATSPWAFNVDGPFNTVYAEKICKSPFTIIGLLSSVSSLVAVLLFIPIADLAEKKGRMNAVVKIRPLNYLGYVIFILAGTAFVPGITPYIPLFVWGLRAAGGVGGPGWEVSSMEGIPLRRLSTWNALQNFTSRLIGIPAPLVGGILWNVDPRAPLIWHLCIEALIRFNIMKKIAEKQGGKTSYI